MIGAYSYNTYGKETVAEVKRTAVRTQEMESPPGGKIGAEGKYDDELDDMI